MELHWSHLHISLAQMKLSCLSCRYPSYDGLFPRLLNDLLTVSRRCSLYPPCNLLSPCCVLDCLHACHCTFDRPSAISSWSRHWILGPTHTSASRVRSRFWREYKLFTKCSHLSPSVSFQTHKAWKGLYGKTLRFHGIGKVSFFF